MTIKTRYLYLALSIFIFSVTQVVKAEEGNQPKGLSLIYDEPAKAWTDALPVGNGAFGGMVFGGVQKDRLQFNHDTLWAGGPHSYSTPNSHQHLEELRRLLYNGESKKAVKLAESKFMSKPLRQAPYQPFGDLILEFPNFGKIKDYQRQLDLDGAIVTTTFRAGDFTHQRSVIASHPDGIIAIRIESNDPKGVSFKASLTTPHKREKSFGTINSQTVWMRGKVNDYVKKIYGRITKLEGKMTFESQLRAEADGGRILVEDGKISVSGAKSVVLYLTGETDYIDYQSIEGNPTERCQKKLAGIQGKSYETILAEHQKDYRNLFRRVKLNLGGGHSTHLTTDERLNSYQKKPDSDFVRLLFQYGRYLLISSSRPGSQPANLQGIWNPHLSPPWESKYTLNINFEMNYWPAEITNLAECHEPLFDMLDELAVTGKEIAKDFYNAPGWVAHHNTDNWRGAAAINNYVGIWPLGGAWLCHHLWEHYLHNEDEEFLKTRGYQLMKGACEFFLHHLVEDPKAPGVLISGPSNSPEHGGFVMGPTMDHQIIRETLLITADVAQILKVDPDFEKKLRETAKKIAPNEVGSVGQLKEWRDKEKPRTNHRHVSHLWSLHPGKEITVDTPELFAAARKTLNLRGDAGTGWSRGWKVNFWARLRDGDRMTKILNGFFVNSSTKRGPGFYNNLFDAHPPFQIDGNFGLTAGVAEALVQSHRRDDQKRHIIDLLPALPSTWPDGEISGLRVRGGFEVSLRWQGGKLTEATFLSTGANPLVIQDADGIRVLQETTKKGEQYQWKKK